MAAARFTGPIEPMDLANMRRNGVRSLVVQCRQCLHELIMNVDHLPGDFTVPSIKTRVCPTLSLNLTKLVDLCDVSH
jgi:hypothetical protein